jgi:hypothetical protein
MSLSSSTTNIVADGGEEDCALFGRHKNYLLVVVPPEDFAKIMYEGTLSFYSIC